MFLRTHPQADIHIQTKHLNATETKGQISLSGVNEKLRFEFAMNATDDQPSSGVTLKSDNDTTHDAIAEIAHDDGAVLVFAADDTLAAVFRQHRRYGGRVSFQTAFMRGENTPTNQGMLLTSLGVK